MSPFEIQLSYVDSSRRRDHHQRKHLVTTMVAPQLFCRADFDGPVKLGCLGTNAKSEQQISRFQQLDKISCNCEMVFERTKLLGSDGLDGYTLCLSAASPPVG